MGLKQMMETLIGKSSDDSDKGAAAAAGEKAKYHRISAKEAKAALDSGEPVILLDVREPYEYKAGHIKNAVSLPSGNVASGAAAVVPDRDAKILVYCLSGARSSASAERSNAITSRPALA